MLSLKEEIAFRKKAKYPPYCHLVSVIVQSRSPKNVHSIALDISQYLKRSSRKSSYHWTTVYL